jgi:tetratricopeptide (TPR) repeat protein
MKPVAKTLPRDGIWLSACNRIRVDDRSQVGNSSFGGVQKAGVRTHMAFGFGFNKQKVLSAAEKYVQQGKLQNAITEYEKVLKNDPKDLTVTNTIGDLYARIGENDKATECFKNVGDAYASQGFTVKAIAMYKKISKLKSSLESVLKLAELYTQQGLFNDARAQYLQVAEEFLRAGELEQAVRIFQKILEMDPENVAMRVRLAEVYIRLGKKTDAWQIFAAAAESLRARGSLSGAEEILQRMLTLDPGNGFALLLRGRNALDSGDAAGAIQCFEKASDLDAHPDGLRDLFKAYLQVGQIADAGRIAAKLASAHNNLDATFAYIAALVQGGMYEDALQAIDENSERLLADNSTKVLETLHSLIGHVRDNPASLEKVLELLQKAGDTSHINETHELLAHAYVQMGELAKARDLYQLLAQQEPQNPMHMQNYQQVAGMMGGTTGSRLITAEEGTVLVEELEATTPPLDQRYAPEIALALRAALTDAELFVSYNMPDKAVGPLMAALPIAPQDVRLNQRLAALHTRAERFGDAAACCRTLESVYAEAGLAEEAFRYGELAKRYEERGSSSGIQNPSVETAHFPESSAAPWPVAPVPHHSVDAPEFDIQLQEPGAEDPAEVEQPVEAAERGSEIDLSAEWDGAPADEEPEAEAAVEIPAETGDQVSETVEEVRFYIEHSMIDQARAAFARLEKLTQDVGLLATILGEIEGADSGTAEATIAEEPVAAVSEETHPEPEPEPEPEATPEQAHANAMGEFVSEREASLGEEFLPKAGAHEIEHEPEVVAHAGTDPALVGHHEFMASAPPPKPAPEPLVTESKDGTLDEFVKDLEDSLGNGFMPGAPAAEPEPHVATAVPHSGQEVAALPQLHMAASAAASPAPAPVAKPQQTTPSVAASSQKAPAATFRTSVRPVSKKQTADAGVDLADMFGELKHELEEDVATTEEDPETHYNLGVAFREMGLLDEAIGELQKVCQSVERGHPFAQVMQTYTWLAQCFLDKGVPEAAIRWYEKALKLPGLDEDTRTALHYELASAFETAQDKGAALQHFMEVYGSNIDYRDVGERIRALKS